MPQPFGFTGELAVGGLQYLRARWYDPRAGVFTARDPFAGFSKRPYSLHPYQYAYSSPTAWTDPSGLCPEDEFFCGFDGLSEDPEYAEHDFSDAKALQDLGTTVDFIPGFGDAKGIHDCVVGRDLLTGEELSGFDRYSGCFCLSELRGATQIGSGIGRGIGLVDDAGDAARRYGDDADNIMRWEDDGGRVAADALITWTRQPVTYGPKMAAKFGKHANEIRIVAREEFGMVIGKKPQTNTETQTQMQEFIQRMADEASETRQGSYHQIPDAIWHRRGEGFIVRKSDGEFITFLYKERQSAQQWDGATPVTVIDP